MGKSRNHTRLGNALMRELVALDGTMDHEGNSIKNTPANTSRVMRALSKAVCDAGYIGFAIFLAAACETVQLPADAERAVTRRTG